jgi:hypothetical protein
MHQDHDNCKDSDYNVGWKRSRYISTPTLSRRNNDRKRSKGRFSIFLVASVSSF